MGVNAYRSAQVHSDPPRQVEHRLLAEVTGGLMRIEDLRTTEGITAIHRNIEVWNTFLTDLVSPENQLPRELRARLISLAIWVRKHSRKVINGEAAIDPLITVNRSIMDGLAQAAAARAAASAAAPSDAA